ncbi:hypothetical protein [Cyclobacterium jeungdonense]|uniref:GLPGLI family protein n=1 Tax=Cyclobacterium jeungdonense TaxID=708087 RepID=A0ABT8C8C1_9BACT|nr:hypothetical protein [Cyclobacterium jeungdonense]MDN3689048.1 hypothetical protein [Cyclobacterium jeungdonense]
MKNSVLIIFIFFISFGLKAQYKNISFEKSNARNLKIHQIDFREFSTLIHFQYTNENSGLICAEEDFYIQDKETLKKYKLLNSLNLPICDKAHQFDKLGQIHNYTLEFERVPDEIKKFDIIENSENGFKFYGVKIDNSKEQANVIDVTSFINDTPVKEYGIYYKDGDPVFYYNHKGITVAVMLTYNQNYGKYYQANIMVKNLSGREFNFDPNQITAIMQKNDKVYEPEVLSYEEYMKKVKRQQNWNAFAVAFSESMSANQAAYSSSSSSTTSSGYSNTTGSASGYVGDTYGSIYGSSSTYGSSYSTTYSQNYDGQAAYLAQQNANKNISNYQANQYSIKQTISEGYLRLNTIHNETEYIGYVNIEYEKKIEEIVLSVPVNGTTYTFTW